MSFEYKEKYKYPTKICLNLTDNCNLACRYCFVEQHPHYMTYDIEYHGWRGETAKNMYKIRDELVKKLLEMYVICKMGLGEDVYESSDVTENNDNL